MDFTHIYIPAWALDKMELQQAVLYGIIFGLCAKHGYCYASDQYLAKIMKRDASAINRYLRNMEANGFISRITKSSQKGKMRELRFIWPSGEQIPQGANSPLAQQANSPIATLDSTSIIKTPLPLTKTANTGNTSPSPAARQKIRARRQQKQQELVEEIFTCWKDTKPLDDSRGRARKHIEKLLKAKVPIQRIYQAAVNYLNSLWCSAEKMGEERPDHKYVRKVGNFFGREGEWEDWTDDRVDQDLLEIRYR